MFKSKPKAHQGTQILGHWTETAAMISNRLCLLPFSVLTARRAEKHRGWFWNHYSTFVSESKPIQPSSGATFIHQAADSNGTEPASCMVQLPGGQVEQLGIVTSPAVLVQSSCAQKMYPSWIKKKKKAQSSEVRVFKCWTLRRETVIKKDQLLHSHPWDINGKRSSVLTIPSRKRQRYTQPPLTKNNHVMIAGTWSKVTNCRRNLSISVTHQTTP